MQNKFVLFSTIIAIMFVLTGCDNTKTLSCSLKADYDDYNIKGKQDFIFEKDTLISYINNSYMKFDDVSKGEEVFKLTDANTEDFNKYEGVSYKVTFNAKNEIRLKIKVDVKAAPEMFKSFLASEGIDEKSSIKELKAMLEENKYSCKVK